MKTTNSKKSWLLMASLILLTGCGSNFNSQSSSGSSGNNNRGEGVTPPVTPPVEAPQLKGMVSGGSYDKTQVLGLDATKGELLLSLPLGSNVHVNLTEMEVTGLPGTRIYTSTAADGKKSIVLAIPLRHILRGASGAPAKTLPNGDAFPPLPGGEATQWGVTTLTKDDLRVYIYAGYDSVGIFAETDFNPYIGWYYDVLNHVQQKVGVFGMIPQKGAYRGGFFMGFRLDEKLARILDSFIK